MKGITIMEPWATAIVRWGKHVENRSQLWAYRGPLLIHAGMRWSDRGIHDHRIVDAAVSSLLEAGVHTVDPVGQEAVAAVVRAAVDLPAGPTAGHIIGICELDDVHPDTGCCRPWGESSYKENGGAIRTGVTHLVLTDVRPLSVPVPCRGALGLWNPPADVITEVLAQLHPEEATA